MSDILARSVCSSCGNGENMIFDRQAGDVICGKCGTVVVSRHIDASSEWRIFEDDDSSGSLARTSGRDDMYGASMTDFAGCTYRRYSSFI